MATKKLNRLKIFDGSRVLITGHTGFKGSWLSLWLSELGAEVHGISLDIPTVPSHAATSGLAGRIKKDYRLNIRNTNELKTLIGEIEPDFVFHLAAQALVRTSYDDPTETWQTNTMGTINVLESLRIIKKPCVAVFVTSDKCYDNVEWVWGYRETDSLGGSDPYSASKGAAELALRSYIRSFFPIDGLIRIGIGRAGNVIGGGDWSKDRIIPDCVRAWSCGNTALLRNPTATRPWQHVLEPLSGYLNLALDLKDSQALHGQPFNFGPPAHQNHSVNELVTTMMSHWEKVQWEVISTHFEEPIESGLLKLNCDKALHFLRWHALWDFEITVRETALWYRRFYEQPDIPIAEFSIAQINAYQEQANLRELAWAI